MERRFSPPSSRRLAARHSTTLDQWLQATLQSGARKIRFSWPLITLRPDSLRRRSPHRSVPDRTGKQAAAAATARSPRLPAFCLPFGPLTACRDPRRPQASGASEWFTRVRAAPCSASLRRVCDGVRRHFGSRPRDLKATIGPELSWSDVLKSPKKSARSSNSGSISRPPVSRSRRFRFPCAKSIPAFFDRPRPRPAMSEENIFSTS